MNKFTWKSIMKSNAYTLVSGEYEKYPCYCDTFYAKEGENPEGYIRWGTCQILDSYYINDERCGDTKDKKWLIDKFYQDLDKWENNIEIKIVNVNNLGYYIYMVAFKAHKVRKDGYEIHINFVHNDDLEAYLKRKENW